MDAMQTAENLIQQLQPDPQKIIQTHISWVLLFDNYIYKIKKPVNLGFVDFSTLAKRKFFL